MTKSEKEEDNKPLSKDKENNENKDSLEDKLTPSPCLLSVY